MSFAGAGTASSLPARGPSPASLLGTALWGRTHAKGYLPDEEGAATPKVFLYPPPSPGLLRSLFRQPAVSSAVPSEPESLEQKALETTQTTAGRKPGVGTRLEFQLVGFFLIA